MKDKRPDLYDLYEDDYDKSAASVRGTKGLITRRQAVMGGTLGLAALGLTAYGFFRPQVLMGLFVSLILSRIGALPLLLLLMLVSRYISPLKMM